MTDNTNSKKLSGIPPLPVHSPALRKGNTMLSKLPPAMLAKDYATVFYRELGERLRVMRRTLGISEWEAADAAGVTIRTYRKWEKGGLIKGALGSDPLTIFCDEFDVSYNWLLAGKGNFLDDHHFLDDLVRRRPAKGVLTDAGRPFVVPVKH
jgi:transcriptional regulator with XRE-family HTH domain